MNERTGIGGLSRRSFLRTAGTSVAALGAGRVLPPLGPSLAQAAHPADPRARKGGTLIMAAETEPNPVDPQREGGWMTFRVSHQMHEALVKEDLHAADAPWPKLGPGLAKSWTVSPDGLVYTFKLREGVKFHDGTPFDANAVKWNVERIWNKSAPHYDVRSTISLYRYRFVKSIDVVDPLTVRFTMTQPFEPFLRVLAEGSYGTGCFTSPTNFKRWGNDGLADHPVGTGPFKFVERVHGQRIVLERNEQYWGTKPYIDRVIFRILPDPATRVAALKAGELDIAAAPPDAIEPLRKAGFTILTNSNIPAVWYFEVNARNKYMQDPRVRRAVAMAINREGMCKNLLRDAAYPARGLQSPGNYAYDPNFQDYPYDPAGAKRLLAEAGHPNGIDGVYVCGLNGAALDQVAINEWVQRDLAKVGIRVKLDGYEWTTYLTKWSAQLPEDVLMSQMIWGFSTPYFLWIIAACEGKFPDGCCSSGHSCNEKLDQVMLKAIAALDEKTATQYWRQANQIIKEDAWKIPYIVDREPYAVNTRVAGFVNPPQVWYDLDSVWLKS